MNWQNGGEGLACGVNQQANAKESTLIERIEYLTQDIEHLTQVYAQSSQRHSLQIEQLRHDVEHIARVVGVTLPSHEPAVSALGFPGRPPVRRGED